MFYSATKSATSYDLDLWYLPLDGKGEPTAILQSPRAEQCGHLSPNGRYLAYMAGDDMFGHMDIYLTDFPSGGSKWQVTYDGGWWPRWNAQGDKLFYGAPDGSVMEVNIATEPSLAVKTRRKLFALEKDPGRPPAFDVSGDGERFVILRTAGSAGRSFAVVENWFAEFEVRR